jgi:hypothetical protein
VNHSWKYKEIVILSRAFRRRISGDVEDLYDYQDS